MGQVNRKEFLFIRLVMQNQQIAMMSLGKIKNPVSRRIEKKPEYAKTAIDTLNMLKEKTMGNLSDYEEQFLNDTLRNLKLIYVSESRKQ